MASPQHPSGPQQPYGAPPQPGWPPPPSYGPAPAPRRGGGKVVGIVLGVVGGLTLLCGGAGVLVFLSGAFSDDPVEVVEAYFAAAERGDCEEMIDRVTEATWRQGGATNRGQAVTDCEQGMDSTGVGFPVELQTARLVSESGGTAIVAATVVTPPLGLAEELDPGSVETEITLRKQGRNWLIDGTSSQDLGLGLESPGLDVPELPELADPTEDPGPDDDPGQDPGTPASLATDELYSSPTFSFRIELEDRVLEGELELLESYDHASCDAAALTDAAREALASCQGRIEGAYVGTSGDLWVSQQVLMFADAASAESFYALIENEYAGDMLSFEDPGGMGGSSYLATRPGLQGQYVVVTMLASTSDSDAAIQEVQDHAHARHAESVAYLIWR